MLEEHFKNIIGEGLLLLKNLNSQHSQSLNLILPLSIKAAILTQVFPNHIIKTNWHTEEIECSLHLLCEIRGNVIFPSVGDKCVCSIYISKNHNI